MVSDIETSPSSIQISEETHAVANRLRLLAGELHELGAAALITDGRPLSDIGAHHTLLKRPGLHRRDRIITRESFHCTCHCVWIGEAHHDATTLPSSGVLAVTIGTRQQWCTVMPVPSRVQEGDFETAVLTNISHVHDVLFASHRSSESLHSDVHPWHRDDFLTARESRIRLSTAHGAPRDPSTWGVPRLRAEAIELVPLFTSCRDAIAMELNVSRK